MAKYAQVEPEFHLDMYNVSKNEYQKQVSALRSCKDSARDALKFQDSDFLSFI